MLSVVYRNQIRLSHRADLASIVDALRRDTCRIDKRILNACKRRDRKAALDLTTKHVLETERFVVALLTQSGAAP
jgi:DNA-binding GntR family transcriptional regulator